MTGVRFGESDRLDDLGLTFGEEWLLASWDDSRAESVHQLLHRGRRPGGWTAPLPDGPWEAAGHIAAEQAVSILTDRASGARIHRTVGDALDVLQRAHANRLRAERAVADMPPLALKRPTGWSTPSAHGLAHRTAPPLGDGFLLLTWPDPPGRPGTPAGRPPRRLHRGRRRPARHEPLRCPDADADTALAVLRRALGEHLTHW
ncbi:hypothetical protein ACFYNO_29330 [Kitasatospora sp. NPDC006697]|uniref:hypothetical protein n=1 Tax=Kitasatospora sp. NPDC006697 TaxID=3364020 RepID=UPI0036B7E3B2